MSEIFIIIFLILLNGIFAMSEMAVISARKSNLQADANKGSRAAKTALKLSSDPDKFLSTVQIGITLIGILTGIFSGQEVAQAFAKLLHEAGVPMSLSVAIAQTIIVILVTYLSIVFGELVPKRIALSASERVAKIVSGPMRVISVIASPFVWILAKSTSLVINLLGVKSQESKVTEEEIKSIIQEGTDEGEVSPVEQDIVERVFALGDLKVNTIMTLRGDIVWLDKDMTEDEVRKKIEENLFECYPVTDGDLDHVIGVLSLKDFVPNVGKPGFNIIDMLHEPVYFHETMSVYAVLEQMKLKKISRALVCDEYGFCSGIITLKDIMEALVGVVNDDHKREPDIIARQDNDGWFVDGQCSMYDFRMFFDIDDTDPDSEYTTVGGLILDELQHVPIAGEKAVWGDFSFEVVDMDGARIDKVIVKRKPHSEPQPPQSA